MFQLFQFRTKKSEPIDTTLSFDGLNPLLAKQLSELETQIGQLAQVQFELGQERQRMRIEMEALKKAVERPEATQPSAQPVQPAPLAIVDAPDDEALQ